MLDCLAESVDCEFSAETVSGLVACTGSTQGWICVHIVGWSAVRVLVRRRVLVPFSGYFEWCVPDRFSLRTQQGNRLYAAQPTSDKARPLYPSSQRVKR